MTSGLTRVWSILTPPQRVQAWLLFGLILLSTALETLSIGLIFPLVRIVSEPESISEIPVLSTVYERMQPITPEAFIVQVSLLLVAVFVFKGVLTVSVIFARHKYIYGVFKTTASRLLRVYMRQQYAFHLKRNSADLSRTINLDAMQFSTKILDPILVITSEALVAIALLALLMWADALATSIAMFILIGGSGLIYMATRKHLSKIAVSSHDASGKMLRWVTTCVNGIREMTVAGSRGVFHRRFEDHVSHFADTQCFIGVLQQTPRPFFETFAVVGVLTIVVVGVHSGSSTDSLVPFLALLAATTFRVMPAINRIFNVAVQIRFTQPQLHAVSNDLSEEENMKRDITGWAAETGSARAPVSPFRDSIRVRDVSYQYEGSAVPAISDIDFEIEKGRIVGFVGASGAGKSTLLAILLGLLTPTRGHIEIDGVDTSQDLAGWRRRIAYIPQEIFILDDTIRANIVFGCEDIERAEPDLLAKVIELVQLEDVVRDLPDGLDTVIGEAGARLSGGQRQRVIIARALYQRPEILIMDEATASLDAETEKEVSDAINRLGGEMTIVIVAHRLSTVKKCDQLYLLDNGKLVGEGSFDTLADHPGFRRMLVAAEVTA